ncbi:MAG: hypothetical protein PF447_08055 [Spirochaetaceae bacterium]|jgi:hypothetical protein|nr:hypothetical protein [Spirochaetaceae bacterium]
MANALETIKENLITAMNENSAIMDTSHIVIHIKSTGNLMWKKSSLHITGRVNLDNEKTEIDKIIADLCSDVEVLNTLRVEQR